MIKGMESIEVIPWILDPGYDIEDDGYNVCI